ncbi:unnamed protein product [Diamesa serratosioi]
MKLKPAVDQTNDIKQVESKLPEVIMNKFPNSHVLDQSTEKGNLIFKNNVGMKKDLQCKFITNEWNESQENKSDNALYETQQDDVKMVKQLLDSESDDNSGKSNLKQQANDEKENVDESDFDFSTS